MPDEEEVSVINVALAELKSALAPTADPIVPSVDRYLSHTHEVYKQAIGYDTDLSYLYGQPINPVMPVDLRVAGVFIVGAYPSAKFAAIGRERDVPVADNLKPFGEEIYFDGAKIRHQMSARELEECYLLPLGLRRSSCWITDLVKVFLFKDGHAEKYARLGNKIASNRSQFAKYAEKSLSFLREELLIAKPKVMMLLGEEVSTCVLKRSRDSIISSMKSGMPVMENEFGVPVFVLPHPGNIMRGTDWTTRLHDEIVPTVRRELFRISCDT